MAKSKTKTAETPKKSWVEREIPLVRLHLDLANYRHEELDTEAAAIAYLYVHEKVEALARDIAAKGSLSPLDRLGVVPMAGNPGHFVAVEGNRRVCSLLLLNDPSRAPTPESRRLMKKLAQAAKLPDRIGVVQFPNKALAKQWIDLRHLGPQDGQGLRRWTTKQKERAADDGGPNRLAVALLDRAQEGGWLGEEKPPAVTTLTRYLRNQEVRSALGLEHHRDLKFTHAPDEVDAALKQFLRDAMPTTDKSQPKVNSRSNDADRKSYARDLRDRGVSPRTLLSAPIEPAAAQPAKITNRKQNHNRPDPALRKCLVPTSFVCNAGDKNLRMLFKEMQRTPIDHHEFSTAFLLRAFIERILTQYLSAVEPTGPRPQNAEDLVKRCAQHLDSQSKNPRFKPLRVAASAKDSSHSLHTLGTAVHTTLLKDRRALISDWSNWEYALNAMLERLPRH